jgi:hypothetical protein
MSADTSNASIALPQRQVCGALSGDGKEASWLEFDYTNLKVKNRMNS